MSDAAILSLIKDDEICQATMTVNFTQSLGLITSSGGEVLFKMGSIVVFQYSDTRRNTDGAEVPGTLRYNNGTDISRTVATVTVTDTSVSVRIINFDVTYEGNWSSIVVGSSNSDVESNSLDVIITSASCKSKGKWYY